MDNAIGLGIILSLQDRASAGLESIRNRLTVLRDVSQDMMKRFDEGAKQMLAGIGSMVSGAKVLGIFNRTFGISIDVAADFEQAMARVGAVSGAVGEDFARLTKQARDLGRDTQYSATQAANSQELLARAGFKTNEIISAMPHLLYMAGAEGMDLARAADIASNTLRGFGLEASNMNDVANILAKTSSITNTSIATLGDSFQKFAPYAKAVNISLEKAAAMIGVIGDAGIKGAEAGTAVTSAIRRLAMEPKAVANALNSLGISAKDAKGNFIGFEELMTRVYAKIHTMGDMEQMNILGRIFGGVSGSAMLALMNATVSGKLDEKINVLNHMGEAAKEMYDRMSATAQGATKRLESATEGLRIAIGNHLLPAYTWAIDKMAEFKSWLTQLIEAHPVITKAVIGLTTALIGVSGAALIVVGALASIGGFIKMWPLMKGAAMVALSSIRMQARMALTSLSGLSVPVIGMIALAGALYYAWRKNLWGIRDMVTAVTEGFKMALSASTDGIAEVDEELANKLKAVGIWDFAVTMGKVFFRVRQFWNGLVEGFNEGLDFLKEGFNWLKDLFAPAVESGKELLKFLGIFKPVANTHTSTWKAWGQLIGRIAPIILTVIAAFKGFTIVVGIVNAITGAVALLNSVLLLNPVIAIAALMIAAGIYIYTHWEELSEWFAEFWNNISGYAQAAADWIKGKWQEFSDWWNSWTLGDIFDWMYDAAANAINKIKQPFIDFKDWILDLFAGLNPFNWELPSWFGGGKTGENQLNNVNVALSGYMPPEIPASPVQRVNASAEAPASTAQNINVPAKFPPVSASRNQPVIVTQAWAKGNEETYARMGINPDVLKVNVSGAIANSAQVNPPVVTSPDVIVNSVQANPPAQNTPAILDTPVVAPPNITVNSVQASPPVVQYTPAILNMPAVTSPDINIIQPDMNDLNNAVMRIDSDINALIGTMAGRDIEVLVPTPRDQAPSSPLLIQHSQNQAVMNGQANVQALGDAPERPVNVNNHVDVKIKSEPANVILDGEKIGSFNMRWIERQNIRNGMGEQ